MPAAWRLVKAKHAERAFDGEGARLFGGRWNSAGTRVVYCSETLALAALEVVVRVQSSRLLTAYVAFPLEFPEALIAIVNPGALPPGWRDTPPPATARQVGDAWIAEARSAVLKVPSAIVEEEYNCLLNPAHADFSRVAIGQPRRFRFDQRLMRR